MVAKRKPEHLQLSRDDGVSIFLQRECIQSKSTQVKVTTLYDAYLKWSTDHMVKPYDRPSFCQVLHEKGYQQQFPLIRDKNGATTWQGIGLRSKKVPKQTAAEAPVMTGWEGVRKEARSNLEDGFGYGS